jgi:hypothetical protein
LQFSRARPDASSRTREVKPSVPHARRARLHRGAVAADVFALKRAGATIAFHLWSTPNGYGRRTYRSKTKLLCPRCPTGI